MCSPGLAMMGVGSAAGAYGAYQQQVAMNQAAEYRATLAERNAELANIQAENSLAKGEREVEAHRQKVVQMKSRQRTGFAASGVLVDSGSAGEVVQDTAAMGEQDAMTIRYNSQLEAWGQRAQAGNYTAEAKLSRMSQRSPWEAGGMSLLTSAGGMGSRMA